MVVTVPPVKYLLNVRSNNLHEKVLDQVHVDIDIAHHQAEVSSRSSLRIGWKQTKPSVFGNFCIAYQ